MFRTPDQPEQFTTEQNLLRYILLSENDFLTEILLEIDESFFAFHRWASGVGQHDKSTASRRLAGEFITKLDTFAGNS